MRRAGVEKKKQTNHSLFFTVLCFYFDMFSLRHDVHAGVVAVTVPGALGRMVHYFGDNKDSTVKCTELLCFVQPHTKPFLVNVAGVVVEVVCDGPDTAVRVFCCEKDAAACARLLNFVQPEQKVENKPQLPKKVWLFHYLRLLDGGARSTIAAFDTREAALEAARKAMTNTDNGKQHWRRRLDNNGADLDKWDNAISAAPSRECIFVDEAPINTTQSSPES